MQKKGELSRLAVNLLIGSLIIILGVIIWIILRGGNADNQEVFTDENIDLKISQVKKVNDNTLDLTLKRGDGEGEFIGLSFAVSDGSLVEVVRINSSMPENQTGNFSLNFVSMNASKVQSISVTPIYINEEGSEVIGNVKDEYRTPNTCSNYCPPKAQCGLNGCGMQCGSGCSAGYLCLNYKCIKQKTSSGGGGGGSTPSCTDTCSSLAYQCGVHTICGKNVNCGTCQIGFTCASNSTCIKNSANCTDTCSTFGYNCGIKNICNISTNCGTCSTEFICNITGLCECNSTCSSLGYQCGTRTVCGNSVNCGTCSTGYTCQTNGTCTQNPCTDTCASLVKQCGVQTICGSNVNCGTCQTGYNCSSGLCIPSCTPTTCAALARNCGTVSDGCGGTLNCGTCSTGYTCQINNGTCMKDCTPTTCSALGRNCGTVSDGCGGTLTCGSYGGGCQTGYTCQINNGTCMKDCTPTTCSALGRNCGTVSDGCGGTLNCGTCSTGYTCQTNGTCIKDVAVTCNGVTCKSGEYCSNGVCLLNVTGNTYFVATNGNDAWPGNFTHPWKTWQKAFNTANAGDIVYFRGGTYSINSGISLSHSGNSLNWIYYFNYPGETPILDCSGMGSSWNIGITLNSIDYTHVKGLQIKNVKQRTGYTDLCSGIFVLESNHVKLENMVLSNIDGSGAYLSKNYYVEVINCDSYNNIDTYATDPGGWGMGFLVDGDPSFTSGYVSFTGCRAWNCSDQGYGAGNVYSPVIFDNCWSYDNGALNGNGMGFKFGMPFQPSDNQMDISVKNCISSNNLGGGFDTNDGPYLLTNWLYNNFAYKNGAADNTVTAYGFLGFSGTGSTTDRIFKNNIAYQDLLGPFRMYGGPYIEQYNSWNTPPGVTANSDDFISLNYSQLKQPRKSDGSLPDVTFGHLKQGSDLIDAGVLIPEYHCATSGSHPGENCREWYGTAPDLGPFESNY